MLAARAYSLEPTEEPSGAGPWGEEPIEELSKEPNRHRSILK